MVGTSLFTAVLELHVVGTSPRTAALALHVVRASPLTAALELHVVGTSLFTAVAGQIFCHWTKFNGKIFFWSLNICPVFGLWRICFPPVLVRTGRRLPVQALGERRVLVAVTGYPRGGAPGPG